VIAVVRLARWVTRVAAYAVVIVGGLLLWPLEIAVGRYLSWRNKRVW
jgi:hypothetical protein